MAVIIYQHQSPDSTGRRREKGGHELTGGEWKVAAVIGPHVNVKPSRSRDFLQLARRPGSPSQVVQTPDHLEHRRQRDPAGFTAQASVGADSVMDVVLHRPIEPDRVGLREEFGLAVGFHEAHKDFVSRLDFDGATAIVNRRLHRGFAVRAKGTIEPNAFHGIVEQLVICLRRVHFGNPVNLRQMDFSLIR